MAPHIGFIAVRAGDCRKHRRQRRSNRCAVIDRRSARFDAWPTTLSQIDSQRTVCARHAVVCSVETPALRRLPALRQLHRWRTPGGISSGTGCSFVTFKGKWDIPHRVASGIGGGDQQWNGIARFTFTACAVASCVSVDVSVINTACAVCVSEQIWYCLPLASVADNV